MTDDTTPAQTTDAGQGTEAATSQAAPAAQDYSWLPPAYVKDGNPDFAAFSSHYAELAAEQARRADAPQPPADGKYTFALPEDFKADLPDGVTLELGVDDPAFADVFTDLGAFMHQANLPQEAATGLMGLLGRYKAAETAKLYAAAKEDYDRLGPTPAARDARLAKLGNRISQRLPENQAKALMATVKSSAAVIALERLMSQNLGPQAAAATHPSAAFAGLRGSALLKALPSTSRA